MATTVDEILVSIKADMSSLQRDLRKLEQTNKGVGESFKRIGQIAAAALSGIGIAKITQTTASFQDLQNSLNVVFKSAENGQAAMQFINDFAQRTPFDIQTLSKAMIQLGGAGIAPTEKMLETMGDAASVTTDKIGAFEAMTKLVTRSVGGGLGLEELEQLADRGIPVYQILTKELGLTRNEVSEFGKDAEGAAKIVDALFTGLDREFGGAMQQGSKLLSTSLSNLGIAATDLMVTMGNALSPALIDLAGQLQGILNNAKPLANAIGSALGAAFRALGAILSLVGEYMREIVVATTTYLAITLGSKGILAVVGVYRTLRTAMASAAAVQLLLNRAATKFGKTGIIGIISGVAALGANIDAVKPYLDMLSEKLGMSTDNSDELANSLKDLEAQLASGLEGPPSTKKSGFGEALDDLRDQLALTKLEAQGYSKDVAKLILGDSKQGIGFLENGEAIAEYSNLMGQIADEQAKVARTANAIDYAKQQTGLEKLIDLEHGLHDALWQNKITYPEYEEAMANLRHEMKMQEPAYAGLMNAAMNAADGVANAFTQMVMSGKFSLDSMKDIASQFIAQLIKMQIQLSIMNPIMNNLFGLGGTSGELPTGGFQWSSIGLGAAGGGAMYANQPRLVGERGPELFVPHSSGTLLNNANTGSALGGGTPVIVNQSLNFSIGVQDTVRAEIVNMLPAINESAVSAVQEAKMRGGSFASTFGS